MSIYSNVRDRYYIYRIQKNSDFFRKISSPSFKLVSFLMKFNAGLIKENQSIGYDVMQRMIGKDYNSIRYFYEPDKRLVWQAAMKNPEVLRSLELNEGQQLYLYEQNHKVYDYINNPADKLLETAILDDWHKGLTVIEPSQPVCGAFLSSAFGIECQPSHNVQEAVVKLVGDCRSIEGEYKGTVKSGPETEQMFEKLRNNGINGMPDYLKEDICYSRYKKAITEFQQSTGFELSATAPVFHGKEGNDGLMAKAFLEGITEPLSTPVPTLKEVYNACAEKIVRQKKEVESCDKLTKSQLTSILGKKDADKLVSVLNDNGRSLSDMSGKDVVNLLNKGTTTMADKSILQKISGPAGYAMQAYQYMESMSSLGQCEM